jgi:hypothetical protein
LGKVDGDIDRSKSVKYVISHITRMPNVTLSVPEEIYRKMKKRSDVRWSEVARRAIVDQLEKLEGPAGFHTSSADLRNRLANAGVHLERVPVKIAVAQSTKMRRLEWKRVSSTRAS